MITVRHRNKEIVYDDENHSYSCDGRRFQSITQNISRFFEKFNMKKHSFNYAIKHNMNQNEVIQKWQEEGKETANF